MKVDDLIADMLEVKELHPSLERSEILRIFNIAALQELAEQIRIAGFRR